MNLSIPLDQDLRTNLILPLLLLYFLQKFLHRLMPQTQLHLMLCQFLHQYHLQKNRQNLSFLRFRHHPVHPASFLRNHYSLLQFLPLQKPCLFLHLLIHQFLLVENPFLNPQQDSQFHPCQDLLALHPVHYLILLTQCTYHPNQIQQAILKNHL